MSQLFSEKIGKINKRSSSNTKLKKPIQEIQEASKGMALDARSIQSNYLQKAEFSLANQSQGRDTAFVHG
jgi:hypothetical protein